MKELKELKKFDRVMYLAKKKELNRKKNEPPKLSTLEEVGNSVTHGVGALISIAALVLMLVFSKTPRQYVSSSIYGFCLIFMFLMSCLYHSFRGKAKRVFRRFDYSGIYLVIGGTFTPLFLVFMNNTLGLVLCIIQWAAIITGIVFVCVFGPGRFRVLHYTMYFVMGWSGLMMIPLLIQKSFGMFLFILIGGVCYTLGMIPFCMKKKSSHFIWHFFVLAGVVVQWFGIFLYLY